MGNLDQFESVFKSATKDRYSYEEVVLRKVAVFTDLGSEQSRRFMKDVRAFLSVIDCRDDCEWEHFYGEQYCDAGEVLELVEQVRPDLICAYRNIHGSARMFPFSLGGHVDVLTQATTTPVLLLPAPTEDGLLSASCRDTCQVMIMTDQLTGSDRLVDHGVRFTREGGKVVLAHLEDDTVFERYMEIISKIPSIDTDEARDRILHQLLKEPRDYISSVTSELRSRGSSLTVVEEVRLGHRIQDCRDLVSEYEIDLVVLNTKDEDQLAMHGLAYPLAIELRGTPLLML